MRRGIRRSATNAEDRAFQELYEHLRDWHGLPPTALARARRLRDLEALHAQLTGHEECIR